MKQKYLKNVVKLRLDSDKCTGCGICLDVCPHNVFKMENKKSKIINKDSCMECGACDKNCPVKAINARSGVGCATAIYRGIITNSEPTCGCDSNCC